jgi:RHS repeat-associated protein
VNPCQHPSSLPFVAPAPSSEHNHARYDSLNRVATARTIATNQPQWQGENVLAVCWGEQFGYDPWGNLLSISPVSSAYTGCTQENLNVSVNTKNQINLAGYAYDSAGNLIAAPPTGTVYAYDAENHLVSTSGQTYLYDGDGKRVEKASGSPLTANKLYWYGAETNPIIETDAAGNELYRYFRFQGLLVTREESNDWVDHYGLDALGSVRWLYSNSGAWDIIDYYPFGGERLSYSTSDGSNTRKFTGKERDPESGNDNFTARYYSSNVGRFLIPDPAGMLAADLSTPQTWNFYTYVHNNPLNFVDPLGLYSCYIDGVADDCNRAFRLLSGGAANLCSDPGCSGGPTHPGGYFLPGGGTAIVHGECVGISIGTYTSQNCETSGVDLFGGNSSDSRAWTFTKAFFGNLASKQYWKSELGEGGCYAVFAEGFNEGGVSHLTAGMDLPPGGGVDDMIRQGGAAAALTYQMSKGLTVPLRSSIYRGILSGSERLAGGAAAADFAARSGEGFAREVSAIRNGTCH